MPASTGHDWRIDPYGNFKFKLKWDGKYVAGVSKVSGLKRTTALPAYRTDGDPTVRPDLPGQTDYEAVTFERGITHDAAFIDWANKIWSYPAHAGDRDGQISLADFRKTVVLEMYNAAGQKVMAFNIYKCWVSAFTSMPDLDANAQAVVIESLTLQNEGFERDLSVEEPTTPAFTGPE